MVLYGQLLLLLSSFFPLWNGLFQEARDSKLAVRLSDQLERLETLVGPELDEAINRTVTNLTVEPGPEKSVKLPSTTSHVRERHDLEAEMLQIINEDRRAKKLPPLKADAERL